MRGCDLDTALARRRWLMSADAVTQALRRHARVLAASPGEQRARRAARAPEANEPMSAARLRWHLSALRFEIALVGFDLWRRKAYDPQQPRWPAGTPGSVGGRWSGEGGSGSEGDAAREPSTSADPPGERPRLRINIYLRGIGDNDGPPLEITPEEPPPPVPEEEPPTAQLRNRFVKGVAKWALRAILRAPLGPIGTAILAFEAGRWLYDSYPTIASYLDGPKTLDELQRGVLEPQKGYDIHHVVEQSPAERAGFPRHMIDAPENLVRIPRLRHWEINSWYETPNKEYGDQSPRKYLQDKDWAERVRVGHEALRANRVLLP